MYLNKEEEKMLNGEQGGVAERLFRLLVRLGDIYGAEEMIPVGSVQVAGVSYKSIGDPGLEFLTAEVEQRDRHAVQFVAECGRVASAGAARTGSEQQQNHDQTRDGLLHCGCLRR